MLLFIVESDSNEQCEIFDLNFTLSLDKLDNNCPNTIAASINFSTKNCEGDYLIKVFHPNGTVICKAKISESEIEALIGKIKKFFRNEEDIKTYSFSCEFQVFTNKDSGKYKVNITATKNEMYAEKDFTLNKDNNIIREFVFYPSDLSYVCPNSYFGVGINFSSCASKEERDIKGDIIVRDYMGNLYVLNPECNFSSGDIGWNLGGINYCGRLFPDIKGRVDIYVKINNNEIKIKTIDVSDCRLDSPCRHGGALNQTPTISINVNGKYILIGNTYYIGTNTIVSFSVSQGVIAECSNGVTTNIIPGIVGWVKVGNVPYQLIHNYYANCNPPDEWKTSQNELLRSDKKSGIKYSCPVGWASSGSETTNNVFYADYLKNNNFKIEFYYINAVCDAPSYICPNSGSNINPCAIGYIKSDYLGFEYLTSYNFYLDSKPPEIEVTTLSNKWYSSNINVNIKCSDSGAGCDKIYYRIVNYNEDCGNTGYISSSNNPTTIQISCEDNSVCIKKLCYYAEDKVGNINSINYSIFCIDKRKPTILDLNYTATLTNIEAEEYFYSIGLYPDYYYNYKGEKIKTHPKQVVITNEPIVISAKVRDIDVYNQEKSGIRKTSLKFNEKVAEKEIEYIPTSCPPIEAYEPPLEFSSIFDSGSDVGFKNISIQVYDQAENLLTNDKSSIPIFLGANSSAGNKLIFLKTYWDSSSEVKQRTNNLGGSSSSKINCYGYNSKCTLIRDIIGKTDEFTDCLWIGPSNNHRNVKIYNFKEIVDLESNSKLDTIFKDYGNKVVYAWVNPKAEDLKKIAICSKNDTGILVDLPFLVSKNVPDGFRMLLTERNVFSVQWEVEYAREQREVNVECYLNPIRVENNEIKICTINEILNGNCDLNYSQKCYCGNEFPCKQDTSKFTIHSCSVVNPKFYSGENRIICKFYDPRDKGIRAEIWFNHEFYYVNGKIVNKKEQSIFETILNFILENIVKILPKISIV